jgi:hypothetical protein
MSDVRDLDEEPYKSVDSDDIYAYVKSVGAFRFCPLLSVGADPAPAQASSFPPAEPAASRPRSSSPASSTATAAANVRPPLPPSCRH